MIALLLALWLAIAPASAVEPGTEFVIILDNSCSMVEHHTVKGKRHEAADPDRRAILGALLVEGLAADTDDNLTVLAFARKRGRAVKTVDTREDLRNLAPSIGTFYEGPLTRAREILEASERRDKMLLFISDGVPNDYREPEKGREVLGLPSADFDTLVLGLLSEDNPEAEGFMKPLARTPDDYVRVTDGAKLVSHFASGYARSLGSKAYSGTLSPGGEKTIEVGQYVTEVLLVTSTVDLTGPYDAELIGPAGRIDARASGDNGCTVQTRKNPTYCDPPRMHYAVWRAPHDPTSTDSWTLRVGGGDGVEGDIAWGFILRYDLMAEAILPDLAKVGETTPIRGRLTVNGAPFDDTAFFERDGFVAEADVGGESVPLKHVGDGIFEGTYTPTSSDDQPVEIRFQNEWMQKKARDTLRTKKPPPLEISSDKPVIDFGKWRGERRATTRCVDFRVMPNHPMLTGQTQFDFEGVPDDVAITVTPKGDAYEACARVRGCCGDLLAPESAALRIDAVDSDKSRATHRIPIRYDVDRTGFLRCWWPWLLALFLLLLLIWFLYGWIKPHDFEEDATIKVAGSERQLNRAASLVLREQPRGRRGFYRNARIALTATGDFVANPRNAAVWVEATGSGGDTTVHLRGPLEIKDRRTRKWVRVEPEAAADGIRTHVVYRLGDIYFRFQ